ncbi:MAG: hypothetical protein ACLTSL_09645 [Odoribacter splanchnicus]
MQRYIKWLLLLTIVVSIISCRDNTPQGMIRKAIGKKVKMQGLDEIQFLDQSMFYQDFRRRYPFVGIIYVDQDCGMCRNTVLEWTKQTALLKTFPDNIAFLFVYRGDKPTMYFKEISDYYYQSEEDVKFHFFIAPDPHFMFVDSNMDIPREIIDMSFLIDENDRILLVGSPFATPQMKELYRKILMENKSE